MTSRPTPTTAPTRGLPSARESEVASPPAVVRSLITQNRRVISGTLAAIGARFDNDSGWAAKIPPFSATSRVTVSKPSPARTAPGTSLRTRSAARKSSSRRTVIAGTLPVSDHEGRALSTLTEFIGLQRTELQPPDEISRGLFGRSIRLALTHRVAADALAAAVLLALSTVWLAGSPFARLDTALIQTAMIGLLAFRRVWPSAGFLAVSAVAFGQGLVNTPLLGDGALLVALYTVAAHQSRIRAAAAAGLLEVGVIMAAVRWTPAGTLPRSLLFLTAAVASAIREIGVIMAGGR